MQYTVEGKLVQFDWNHRSGYVIRSLGMHSINTKTKDEAHYHFMMYFMSHITVTDIQAYDQLCIRLVWSNKLIVNVPEEIVNKVKQVSSV